MEGSLIISIYIFVLAIFAGFELITRVPPLLHTPLMSGANAISGVTLVGALIMAGAGDSGAVLKLAPASGGWSCAPRSTGTRWFSGDG